MRVVSFPFLSMYELCYDLSKRSSVSEMHTAGFTAREVSGVVHQQQLLLRRARCEEQVDASRCWPALDARAQQAILLSREAVLRRQRERKRVRVVNVHGRSDGGSSSGCSGVLGPASPPFEQMIARADPAAGCGATGPRPDSASIPSPGSRYV